MTVWWSGKRRSSPSKTTFHMNNNSTNASPPPPPQPNKPIMRFSTRSCSLLFVWMLVHAFATRQILWTVLSSSSSWTTSSCASKEYVSRITSSSTTTTLRHLQCTSPEQDVPWPFDQGPVTSQTSSDFTCGWDRSTSSSSPLVTYLQQHTLPQLEPLLRECPQLLVYGVAFGSTFVDWLRKNMESQYLLDTSALLEKHGKCFFMFVLQEDMMKTSYAEQNNHTTADVQLLHHLWLVPIPRHVLPYQNQRRNTKLLKYHGHFLFSLPKQKTTTTTIIWQDAKFFQRTYIRNQPRDYTAFATPNHSACLTVMTLPVHANTFGMHNIRTTSTTATTHYQPKFIHHCETILDSLQKRPNVTDSPESLMLQCQYYLEQQQQADNDAISPDHLDHMLLDSAFLIWNYSTNQCRTFNAELQCTLSEQIHCHSDRDQVSFPYAMAQMGLQPIMPQGSEPSHTSLSNNATATPSTTPTVIDQRQQDVQLVRRTSNKNSKKSHPDVMVHMIKSACHWYFRALDDCPVVDKPSVAILVAGSTRRFQFTSMTLNLLQPLAEQNYNVDVYAMLTQQEGRAYRQDAEYMQHVVSETYFRPQQRKRTIIKVFQQIVEKSGAFLRGVEIRKYPLPINSTQLEEKRREAKRKRSHEDSDYRFPTLDLRPHAKHRAVVGNQNILNLFYGLQYIWDEFLIPYETSIGKPYDYVMIVREDALWLDKFDMAKLLAINPEADAFVQSCDARNPPMLDSEINDHGIVIKRSKAEVVGRYFSSLLSADLTSCHAQVHQSQQVGDLRGCNSEMILKWILDKQNITVQGVPQSILPFERSMSILWIDGNVYHCFHKFCQSKDLPLEIEDDIPFCKDVSFSTNSTSFAI